MAGADDALVAGAGGRWDGVATLLAGGERCEVFAVRVEPPWEQAAMVITASQMATRHTRPTGIGAGGAGACCRVHSLFAERMGRILSLPESI